MRVLRSVGPFLAAVALSAVLGVWLEFWYRFGATTAPELFWGSTIVYVMMAAAIHAVFALGRRLPRWTWLLLCGIPGMALEWFVIGNSPWGNPDASQLGMILFHCTWPIWGRVFDRTWFSDGERRFALIWMGAWSVGLLPFFLIEDPGWRFAAFIWLPLIPYAGLFWVALRRGWPPLGPAPGR